MWGKLLSLVVVAFLLGWTSHIVYGDLMPDMVSNPGIQAVERPQVQFMPRLQNDTPRVVGPQELASPSDWLKEEDIELYDDRVVVHMDDPQWAVFTDTNSMDPLIDVGSHAIQRVPNTFQEIRVGDVISYQIPDTDDVVIHRVVEVGFDTAWYARTKGDNNPVMDPHKVRFRDVKRVLVGVLY